MAKLNIQIPNCPECNSPASGTVETIPACAELEHCSDGTAAYSGYTEPIWEEQETNRDSEGRIELVCENQHHWFSKVDDL